MVPVGVEPELFVENKFKFKGKHSPGESSPIFSFSFKHEDGTKRHDAKSICLFALKIPELEMTTHFLF